jgi:DGQHR domain-containing protein
MERELRVPAIEVRQGPGRILYTFAIDGKLIPKFATVSRIRRTDSGFLDGYQRPEVLSHIAEIRAYVESERPMIPNAIVLAFDSRVRFQPSHGPESPYSRPGELVIPIDESVPDIERPGFIVDGQQRVAAIREAAVAAFPICVSAFLSDDLGVQTEQFILVNSTKPLPKGLIYELLPSTAATLPPLLLRRRLPAELLNILNTAGTSPLRGMIQTATNPNGVIKDNSVLRMLEQSLSDGLLYRYQVRDGSPKRDSMVTALENYWRAVSKVFAPAWGLPPKKSRLTHGAGILSMGLLMDAIADRHRSEAVPAEELFFADLTRMKDVCRWTEGYWDFGPGRQRKWNEVQNTGKDIQLLANYLLVKFRATAVAHAPQDHRRSGLCQASR